MNITRRIHLNPQSKGNLGKSFEAEFRTAWLDRLGIPWNGSDLDDRHHTFANRHPGAVQSYQLGNEHESKTALLKLFRRVLKDAAPVHVIDTRAQADALILGAIEELQVLDICAEQGVRLTFFLFPTDDTESMTNVGRLFLYAGDRVDYVIVHNPAKARGDLFKGSQLESQLTDFGAKAITLSVADTTGSCNCNSPGGSGISAATGTRATDRVSPTWDIRTPGNRRADRLETAAS